MGLVRLMILKQLGITLMSPIQCSFGGIIVLTVRWMLRQLRRCMAFSFEIIIAPSYTDEAPAILTNKKKTLRILILPFDAQDASEVKQNTQVLSVGLLVQNQDVISKPS